MLRVDMQELEEAIGEMGGDCTALPPGIVDLHTAKGRKIVHERTGMALITFDDGYYGPVMRSGARAILLFRRGDEDICQVVPMVDQGQMEETAIALCIECAKKGIDATADESGVDVEDADMEGMLVGPEYYCGMGSPVVE